MPDKLGSSLIWIQKWAHGDSPIELWMKMMQVGMKLRFYPN